MRILVLADSPTSSTGFAQVSRNILNKLVKTGRYQFDVIGINFHGDYYDRDKFPYAIYPAMPQGYADMYGRGRVLSALAGREKGLEIGWDLVFTIQDPFIIEGLGVPYPFAEQLRVTKELWKRTLPPEQWFRWIGYFPVDAPVKENWVTRSIALADIPVAYCDYGKEEIMRYDRDNLKLNFNVTMGDGKKSASVDIESLDKRIESIPHGVDLDVFKVLPKEEIKAFRDEFFGGAVTDGTYLIVNISRNQPRKDIIRTLSVFSEFKKLVPNSHLYLHMKEQDVGGSVLEMARNFGLTPNVDFSLPDGFDAGNGYTVDVVNKIYNAADICLTTTLGEGWGFITSEAMATKTPIIAPNITSIRDIFNCKVPMSDLKIFLENGGWDTVRGIPVLAGSNKSEWFSLGQGDNERLRPLTNVEDMVAKLYWAYNSKEKVKEITDRAYEWVQQLSWDNVVDMWDKLFQREYEVLKSERLLGNAVDKINRNDLCPCESGKKFKHCHGSNDHVKKIEDLFVEKKD